MPTNDGCLAATTCWGWIVSNQTEIRPVQQSEADRLAATVTLAFCADPAARWIWPDANQHISALMPLVGAFGGEAALENGTAHVIGDFLGVAIWLQPGVGLDEEAMGEIFAKHVKEPHLSAVNALFEAMADYHPQEPHWYLPLMGVDPAYWRRGLGSALLQHALSVCDRNRTPAYLEATSPASARLYQRHGFEVLGEIVIGSSPPLFPMIRNPR